MRKGFLAGLVLAAAAFAAPAMADGMVSEVGRCNTIFTVAAPEGYAVVEWASGPVPARGDTLVGNLASTGQKNVTLSNGASVGVLIESWGMNQAAATQMLKSQCGLVTGPFGIRRPPL